MLLSVHISWASGGLASADIGTRRLFSFALAGSLSTSAPVTSEVAIRESSGGNLKDRRNDVGLHDACGPKRPAAIADPTPLRGRWVEPSISNRRSFASIG